ncbi:MAG: Deoxyuridine 5'-triphosphate nucleotidohydrolase [Candidatus Izimaplasma bacterium HR2]|nr:MAG: Deoxyuridine 5'-triphosphate nucleotidohydrolase [Candidatus Izimaplasma bacterium HR2]
MIGIKIYRDSAIAVIPKYKTKGSAGADIYSTETVTLQPGERVMIKTGLYFELPIGIEMQIRPRSGLAAKFGITMINCVGTLDSDYRGELKVPLINLSNEPYTVQVGDRIAQMIFAKYEISRFLEVSDYKELEKTERGQGGFGSTGK